MEQQTFTSQASLERFGRKSRRELFLYEMERVVPWAELQSLVEPYHARAGRGSHPVGLGIMLRVYSVQQWFNLSAPGVEEATYEWPVLLRFTGMTLNRAAAPDETTVCRSRHLLEAHALGGAISGPESAPSSSTRSAFSNSSSASTRYAIAVWRRTTTGSVPASRWRTCIVTACGSPGSEPSLAAPRKHLLACFSGKPAKILRRSAAISYLQAKPHSTSPASQSSSTYAELPQLTRLRQRLCNFSVRRRIGLLI